MFYNNILLIALIRPMEHIFHCDFSLKDFDPYMTMPYEALWFPLKPNGAVNTWCPPYIHNSTSPRGSTLRQRSFNSLLRTR